VKNAANGINGHRRVLVVDRDPDTAASLRMLLQLQGHDVRIAKDRTTAVPAAQEFHPDTVVIDSGATTGAPGELVRALRLLPETAHAALLCISADAAPDDPAQEGLFDHYLVKPVEPQMLQQVLAQTSPTLH
jgi:two-component system, sensor histidine kinase